MGEITQWLKSAGQGDSTAMGFVFDQLYPELKRLAQIRLNAGNRSLSPTVLVHEIFMRFVGNESLELQDRRHFMACAAKAMRAVMIDHVRRSSAAKRGGPGEDLIFDDHFQAGQLFPSNLIALDAALDQLNEINPVQREVVELHYFAGLGYAEIGVLLNCSERTAKREWSRARAFLHAQLKT